MPELADRIKRLAEFLAAGGPYAFAAWEEAAQRALAYGFTEAGVESLARQGLGPPGLHTACDVLNAYRAEVAKL